jgi:hypothetical protein
VSKYETDLHDWALAQADALRRRATNELDFDNLAEEIDDLVRSSEHEIESRLENLLLHLLKWRYQPMLQCGSWRSSIIEARFCIARVLKKNSSLRGYPSAVVADLYPTAKVRAIAETGRDDFPAECPFTIEQIQDEDFLP